MRCPRTEPLTARRVGAVNRCPVDMAMIADGQKSLVGKTLPSALLDHRNGEHGGDVGHEFGWWRIPAARGPGRRVRVRSSAPGADPGR